MDATDEKDLAQASPSPQRAVGSGASWRVALAGAVGAGAALATGEFFAGLSRRVPSLVIAVAEVLIGRADAQTAGAAIDAFGTNNKRALLIGIISVALLVGVVAARAAARRPRVLALTYVLFGALGAWAAAGSPLATPALGVVVAAIAAAVGWSVTWRLMHLADQADQRRGVDSSLHRATQVAVELDRRRFLTSSLGWGGGAAATAMVGRALRASNNVEGERAEVAQQLAEVNPGARLVSPVSDVADVDGITPYVTPTADFFRIDTSAEIPQIDPEDWSLKITGLVDQPLELTLDDLLAEELVEAPVTISCVSNPVGGGYAGNAVWTGVPLARLLDRAGAQIDATQVVGRSFTGWTGGFPRQVVDDGRTALVAVGMNGEPLPVRHGFPARLVVSGLYGYVSATKWLSELELTRWDDFDAYWVQRSWAKEGPIKLTSRIDVPRNGSRVAGDRVDVAGVAWAPPGGVSAVEVRFDDLDEWLPAQLAPSLSPETWVQWSLSAQLGPGTHIAQVRATDGQGQLQAEGPRPSFPDGAEGYHRIRFEVT